MSMYPFKFEPIYVETVWGNTRFARIRGENEIIGSSWEISAHPHADNLIANGKYKGQTLSNLLDLYPKQIFRKKEKKSNVENLIFRCKRVIIDSGPS